MRTSKLIGAECVVKITPEYLRLYHLTNFKNLSRLRKLAAARRALSICNKLKPSPTKALHAKRIFSAINKLRVVV
jgi:hypothetical protein